MKLISFVDDRHSTDELSYSSAAKLYLFHIRFWGPNSCLIEDYDIELDPVEDLGISQKCIKSAEDEYHYNKVKKFFNHFKKHLNPNPISWD